MSKRLFEADIPDGTHLSNAADDPDYKRALLRDDKTGRLVGQIKLLEVDKSESGSRDTTQETAACAPNEYEYLQEESSLTPQQKEVLGRIGGIIGEIAYAALDAFLTNAMNAARVRIAQWWHDDGAKRVRTLRSDAGSFLTAFLTGEAHLKADEYLARHGNEVSTEQAVRPSKGSSANALSERVSQAYDGFARNITSAEAQRELFEIVYDASVLARKINRLSQAHIVDSDTSEYIGWAELNGLLSEQNLIDGINRILSGEVEALNPAQIASFELFLGRDLRQDGVYLPISAEEYARALGIESGIGSSSKKGEPEDLDESNTED